MFIRDLQSKCFRVVRSFGDTLKLYFFVLKVEIECQREENIILSLFFFILFIFKQATSLMTPRKMLKTQMEHSRVLVTKPRKIVHYQFRLATVIIRVSKPKRTHMDQLWQNAHSRWTMSKREQGLGLCHQQDFTVR